MAENFLFFGGRSELLCLLDFGGEMWKKFWNRDSRRRLCVVRDGGAGEARLSNVTSQSLPYVLTWASGAAARAGTSRGRSYFSLPQPLILDGAM
jgi:hypothetical protein